jgi:Fur family ferric uptake transcriptional regulator
MVEKTRNMEVREKVKQLFTEYLTKRKHRKTPERYAILDMIYSLSGHFNIESLYTMMEETAKFRVSRATLYNTLILLLDAHLVVKHQFGTTSQYEKCFNKETHHHMICTQCGRVTEFHNEQLQADIEGAKLPRFRQTHYSLYVYGLCSKCQWKQNLNLKKILRAESNAENEKKKMNKVDAKSVKKVIKKKETNKIKNKQ